MGFGAIRLIDWLVRRRVGRGGTLRAFNRELPSASHLASVPLADVLLMFPMAVCRI